LNKAVFSLVSGVLFQMIDGNSESFAARLFNQHNNAATMTTSLPSSLFAHEEKITIAPYQQHAVVRLEATTSLKEPYRVRNKENIDVTTITPFPRAISQLVQDYGISRLFLASGSSSSTTFDVNHPFQDEFSTGPSGICVIVEMKDTEHFMPLLQTLAGYRCLLAPLDAIQQSRLHRHVYKSILDDGNTQLQVTLPLEGSAVALEGVRYFLMIANVCPQHGIFSSKHASALSGVLLGDSDCIAVSQQERRSMWMDVQSTCNNHEEGDACNISLQRGLQYGVVLNGKNDSQPTTLSSFVPFTSFQHCPVASSNALLSTMASCVNVSSEECCEETVVEDWSLDAILDISPTQSIAQETGKVYGNRILLRPNGIANYGSIMTRIGSSLDCTATVQVVEVLPPFIAPLWDTWTLTTKPLLSMRPDGTVVVEYNVTLSPKTELQVTLDYEPVLVPFQQFPADPNRGMELPPTQFLFKSECVLGGSIKVYSSPLLLMPPVPDMSMPFNVISLTCTLYAFVIGSLANLMIRKASQRIKTRLHPDENKSKFQKLKERIQNKLRRFRKKNCDANANGDELDNESGKNEVLSTEVSSNESKEAARDTSKEDDVDLSK